MWGKPSCAVAAKLWGKTGFRMGSGLMGSGDEARVRFQSSLAGEYSVCIRMSSKCGRIVVELCSKCVKTVMNFGPTAVKKRRPISDESSSSSRATMTTRRGGWMTHD